MGLCACVPQAELEGEPQVHGVCAHGVVCMCAPGRGGGRAAGVSRACAWGFVDVGDCARVCVWGGVL